MKIGIMVNIYVWRKDHINYISNKISKSVGILKFLRYVYPKHILRMIYMSLIYSYLNYCNLIWGSASMTALEPIFLLQKKAVRIINKSKYLDETAPIFKSLNILTIHQIFKLSCLVFMYKCMKSEQFPEMRKRILQNSQVHNYKTRSKDSYRPPFQRLEKCQKAFLYQGINLWNCIKPNIRKYNSIISYKQAVKRLLINGIL